MLSTSYELDVLGPRLVPSRIVRVFPPRAHDLVEIGYTSKKIVLCDKCCEGKRRQSKSLRRQTLRGGRLT